MIVIGSEGMTVIIKNTLLGGLPRRRRIRLLSRGPENTPGRVPKRRGWAHCCDYGEKKERDTSGPLVLWSGEYGIFLIYGRMGQFAGRGGH